MLRSCSVLLGNLQDSQTALIEHCIGAVSRVLDLLRCFDVFCDDRCKLCLLFRYCDSVYNVQKFREMLAMSQVGTKLARG